MKQISLRAALGAALALALWCLSALACGRAQALCGGVAVSYAGGGVSPAQIVRQQADAMADGSENQPEITLWQEHAAVPVEVDGGRSANAAVTVLFGDGQPLLPRALRYGSLPARSDPDGCVVSQGLADALWGGVNVLGLSLRVDGRDLTVRGVSRDNTLWLAYQAPADSVTPMGNLLLRFPQGGGRAEAQDFITRWDMSGGQMLDLTLLGWCARMLAALPAAALALSALARVLRRGRALRAHPALLASFGPPALLLCGGVLLAAGFPPRVPSQLIPTRWSDFDFWARLLSDMGGTLAAWVARPLTRLDVALLGTLAAATLLALIAAAGVLGTARRVGTLEGKGLLAACLVSPAVMLTMAWLLRDAGGLTLTRPMLLTPLAWMASNALLMHHSRWLSAAAGKEAAPYEAQDKAQAPGTAAR